MKKVLLLFGGNSEEHFVSCKSAKAILENIDISKFTITSVGISKDNIWYIFDDKLEFLEFEEDLAILESIYFKWMSKYGYVAQEARYFLPTGVKTELVMTGFVSDWEHFFKLRCYPTAHPQARELAVPLKEEFVKKGLI